MSHKTKVKAGGSTPPSVETIIREHSKARVLVASTKRYLVEQGSMFAIPKFSRKLTDSDVKDSLVKQYT